MIFPHIMQQDQTLALIIVVLTCMLQKNHTKMQHVTKQNN